MPTPLPPLLSSRLARGGGGRCNRNALTLRTLENRHQCSLSNVSDPDGKEGKAAACDVVNGRAVPATRAMPPGNRRAPPPSAAAARPAELPSGPTSMAATTPAAPAPRVPSASASRDELGQDADARGGDRGRHHRLQRKNSSSKAEQREISYPRRQSEGLPVFPVAHRPAAITGLLACSKRGSDPRRRCA
jgi:hypothetical protein